LDYGYTDLTSDNIDSLSSIPYLNEKYDIEKLKQIKRHRDANRSSLSFAELLHICETLGYTFKKRSTKPAKLTVKMSKICSISGKISLGLSEINEIGKYVNEMVFNRFDKNCSSVDVFPNDQEIMEVWKNSTEKIINKTSIVSEPYNEQLLNNCPEPYNEQLLNNYTEPYNEQLINNCPEPSIGALSTYSNSYYPESIISNGNIDNCSVVYPQNTYDYSYIQPDYSYIQPDYSYIQPDYSYIQPIIQPDSYFNNNDGSFQLYYPNNDQFESTPNQNNAQTLGEECFINQSGPTNLI